MNIKINRAIIQHNEIIEISTAKTKILLDGGINLEENEVLMLQEMQELYPFSAIDAVFLSHYKTDHITMTRGLLQNVPVYTGKLTSRIALAAEAYKAKKPFEFAGVYKHGVPITVGDIKVTPYQVDDNVFDGFLLLIEGDGKSILYTGDYRANGRKSFEEMLKDLPAKVDVLLSGIDTISKGDVNLLTERDIEEQATKMIETKKGPVFIMQSMTDFDRTATMFHAAHRNKRVFLEDLYLSQLATGAGKAMPNPTKCIGIKAYLTTGYKEEHFRYKMFTSQPRISKSEIASQRFVMCIRASMKKYIKTLSQCRNLKDGLIINTLQDESFNSQATLEFLEFAQSKGLETVTLRSSGHADAMALKALIKAVKPKRIVPLAIKNVKQLTIDYPKTPIVTVDAIQC